MAALSLRRSTRTFFLLSSLVPQFGRLLLRLPGAIAAPLSQSSYSSAPLVPFLLAATGPLEAEEPETRPGSPAFFLKLAVVTCLVLVGGLLAGLTLALMSQDTVNLTVMEASGDELERKRAAKVLKLLKKGQHWVLVTLLLYNTITNETLPIFLDSILGGGLKAVVSSTALILLFGEVIPQAICSRYGLAIGATSVPIMTILMYLSYPLSYPVALLLDRVLGHDEGVTYKKKELKTFVSLHRHLGAENLLEDEVTIISAVLELADKVIKDIMVPIEDIYSISSEQVLDEETVGEILRQGYSRVPVYEKQNKSNFIGMLLVKNLVIYDPEDAKPVSSFNLMPLPEAEAQMSCLEALNFFQQGRSHMMLVSSEPGENTGALGIVSLEDVIEELIGEEIIDETDLFLDVANKIKVVRRPQIRTGAAKKLTPLLKDVAEKRRNKGTPPANGTASPRPGVGGGKLSRANSDAGSDAGLLSPNLNTSRDYGTISSTASNGASTPRRRPSAPHRLGSITSTGVAFDKVKVKGGNSLLRQQTLEAVRQNLEAIGSGVDDIREIVPENEGGNLPTSSSNAKLSTNGTEDGSEDSAVTVTATAKVKPEDLEAGDDKEDEEGEERLADAKSIMDAKEQDENAPLLGGKQVAGSPGNY